MDRDRKRTGVKPEGDRQNEADRARHHQWQRNPGGIDKKHSPGPQGEPRGTGAGEVTTPEP
jgi:hypothetical protein